MGRSHECDYPERVKALPVCTRPRIAVEATSQEIDRQVKESARTSVSIYDVFGDVIEGLRPTHILTQIQCDVCAVSLRDVELAIDDAVARIAAQMSEQWQGLTREEQLTLAAAGTVRGEHGLLGRAH